MRLNQEKIERMFNARGGTAGGGSGDSEPVAGMATQAWTEENYISKTFFNELFIIHKKTTTTVYDGDVVVSTTVDTSGIFAPNEIPSQTESTDAQTGYRTVVETEVDNIEAKEGLWTDFFLSALGLNSSGGGGGSDTLAGLLDVELDNPTANQVLTYYNGKWRNMAVPGVDMNTVWQALGDTTTTQQIAHSHLTTALNGYATQQWVGQQGFLTSSALNGYATQTWVTNNFSTPSTVATQMQTYAKIQNGTITIGDASLTPITSVSGTFWGNSWTNGGTVTGSLTGVVQIDMTGHLIMHNGSTGIYLNSDGTGIDWHNAAGEYVSSLIAFTSAQVQINQDLYIPSPKIIRIGDAVLVWDGDNNALKLRHASGANDAVNFYATGGVSALGYGPGGGGGGGDVTWELLADNTDTRQIALSHLTTALAGYATTSQLAGYLPLTGGTLTGQLTVNKTSTVYTDNIVTITNGYTSAYPRALTILFPSLVTSGANMQYFGTPILFGRAESKNNAGTLSFFYYDNQSTSNAIAFGFYNNDNLLLLNAAGNVGIGTTTPAHKLHVNGNIATGSGNGAFIQIGGLRLSYDSVNSAFRCYDGNGTESIAKFAYGLRVLAPLSSYNDGLVVKINSQKYGSVGIVDDFSQSPNEALFMSYADVNVSSIPKYGFALVSSGTTYRIAIQAKDGTLALTSDIPTDNNQLTNGAGYITSAALSGYLPLTGGTLTMASLPTGSGVLNINSTTAVANNFSYSLMCMCSGMTADTRNAIAFGKAFTEKNCAIIHYYHAEDYSDANILSFGFHSVNHAINLFANGNVSIGRGNTTSPSYKLDVNGSIYGSSFVKANGTSAQFLKADGSVDSNSYALASQLGNYLPLTGGTITGTLITSGIYPSVQAKHGNVAKMHLGYYPTGGYTYLSNESNYYEIRLYDGGGLYLANFTTTSSPIYKIWNENNDGTGSGLDADLLDGQHASYFATASSLDNYLPLTGGTISGSVGLTVNRSVSSGECIVIKATNAVYSCIQYMNGTTSWSAGIDSSTNEFYFYNNRTSSSLTTIDSYGKLTTVSALLNMATLPSNEGVLNINSTYGNASFNYSIMCMSSGLTATCRNAIAIGKSFTSKNCAIIAYYNAGAASDSNFLSFGLHSKDNILNIFAGGGVTIGKDAVTAPSYTLDVTGNAGITLAATSSSQSVLYLSNTYNLYYARCIDITFPNQATGYFNSPILFGKSDLRNNKGTISFGYAGNQSNSNFVGIGFYANDNILNVTGAGYVGVGTTSPSYKLHVAGTIYSSTDITANNALYVGQGIILNPAGAATTNGGFLDFRYAGAGSYTSRIIEDASGRLYLSATNGVRIGDAVLRWESNNNALRIESPTGGAVNLYTTGGLSALGISGAVDGTVNASLIPSTTGTYTLGRTSYGWKELYLADANSHNGKIFVDYDGINLDSGTGGYFSGTRYIIAGRLAVGTPDDDQPNYDLYVAGNTYVDGSNAYFYGNVSVLSLTQRSDMRLKDVVNDLNLKVSTIAQAPSFKYRLKNGDGTIMVGSSAQYWDALLPEVIHRDAEGILGLDYGVTALASVISVAREVTEHERRIARLEAENAILRAQIEDLKAA